MDGKLVVEVVVSIRSSSTVPVCAKTGGETEDEEEMEFT
ncbi:hypothetical protein CVS40_8232 [Lucilia cuprina]|nr:hypothetical protein CVS40_8232 [Lucilia cuprina]